MAGVLLVESGDRLIQEGGDTLLLDALTEEPTVAKNRKFANGRQLAVACTHPATPASGGPVRLGSLCGVALENERADGLCAVDFQGVYNLSVKAVNAGGNVAVAAGDTIYYVDADTPVLSAKIAGVLFGTALEAITSGSTATIAVRLAGAPEFA